MAELFQDKYRIQSARCPNWDYSSNGAYFITICTDQWEGFFGKIEDKRVILSDAGRIAEQRWEELAAHFPFIEMDAFVIMPNHMHGILHIDKNILPEQLLEPYFANEESWGKFEQISSRHKKSEFMSRISPKKGSISIVIRSYKSACTNAINKTYPGLNFQWQSRFHDHIIRDKQSHRLIRQYILGNPSKWNDDLFFR
jgi:REP element-mobilizing transposase RayT